MAEFLDTVVDLEAQFYSEGLKESESYDLSADLEIVEKEAVQEATSRASLVGNSLGYLQGLQWLISNNHLKPSTSLQNTMAELESLCDRIPSANQELTKLSEWLDRIRLLSKKCKATLAAPSAYTNEFQSTSKCKQLDF